MKWFIITLLLSGIVSLALRPLLSTSGEPGQHLGGVVIVPLPDRTRAEITPRPGEVPGNPPKPKPRRKPGRTIEQILNNPLG